MEKECAETEQRSAFFYQSKLAKKRRGERRLSPHRQHDPATAHSSARNVRRAFGTSLQCVCV